MLNREIFHQFTTINYAKNKLLQYCNVVPSTFPMTADLDAVNQKLTSVSHLSLLFSTVVDLYAQSHTLTNRIIRCFDGVFHRQSVISVQMSWKRVWDLKMLQWSCCVCGLVINVKVQRKKNMKSIYLLDLSLHTSDICLLWLLALASKLTGLGLFFQRYRPTVSNEGLSWSCKTLNQDSSLWMKR